MTIPLAMMGYYNPMLKYGIEKFCKKASEAGVSLLIIPDMPLNVYEKQVKSIYEKYQLKSVFLITPQTPDERLQKITALSSGFVYAISSASTTGQNAEFSTSQIDYFKKIKTISSLQKVQIGFGIRNSEQFESACEYANGAIIGSAFIQHLTTHSVSESSIQQFISNIKKN
jgi:tryptophan synthase alpha chain